MLAVLGLALGPLLAHAGSLHVTVTSNGKAVTDAVVSLHSPAAAAAVKPKSAVIDQVSKQFVPLVTIVPVGSEIRFPNSDNIRHDVYSFSPAKRFELPLYSGQKAPPVLFDKPGVVTLGCNIHDWMLAYVVVVDSPYYGMTGRDGQVTLTAPAGHYRMEVWHANLPVGSLPVEQDVVVSEELSSLDVPLTLIARPSAREPRNDKLRALEEKFHTLKDGG